MSDGPKFTINSADVQAANRIRITADETISTGTFRIESTDGTRWHVVGADYGSEPSRSAVTTTCARCSATIDPAAVEQHHAVCFRVGDWVRWEVERSAGMRWIEGELLWISKAIGDDKTVRIRVADSLGYALHQDLTVGLYRANLRHIQRPGQVGWQFRCQGDRGGKQCERYAGPPADMGWRCPDHELQDAMEAMEQFTPILPPEVDPLDVEYDGWKLRDLLEAEEHSRHEGKTDNVGWAMAGGWRCATPAQRAAVSAHWSAELRARISAAMERERLTVRVDDQGEP